MRDAFGNLMYVYWRTQEEKDRVPELSDPGIRQQVVDAWKLQQGRTMAEKRAAELLKLVQEKKQPLAEALGGQTVTGKPDGAAVTVREPAAFSFLTVSRTASPFGFGQPGPSQVDGVEQPGMDFMKVVFDDLEVGETGVATNFPRTSYYVVRVLSRDGTGEDGEVELARLREKFSREIFTYGMPQFPTPYDILSQATVGPLYQDWMEQLRTKYEVVPQEQLLDASAVGQNEE